METVKDPMVEYGLARHVLPGQGECGDLHLVCCNKNGVLIAAIDGIGHGEEAANVSRTAAAVLKNSSAEPVISLVEGCHESLRGTRGAVISLAFIAADQNMMTWLGIGNVQGVLMRAQTGRGNGQESLLLRGGVVGSQLPSLQATVLPVSRGDTIIFATDGIRNDFSSRLSSRENPQRAANRILNQHLGRNDDALVLVARLMGINR